ncbi:TetR/AcrR family transcriptional regulator [Actinocorallia longicatena]|uniref:TetR/AcrR family transcriptional regulator n=1 Tax=Actinocorallia longicatena TaxID=111803 RepID=A0ABP6PZI1_9ACTN
MVIELLVSGGTDAVHLREVARRARVSLATIYKHFPARDDLIVTALERWMAANTYTDLAPPAPGEPLRDGLMRVFRYVFEPWERHPRMLEAFHRARTGPGGHRLDRQGMAAIEPVARAVLEGADPDYAGDIDIVLTHMAYALIGRFADGALEATAILPMLERVVFRLTADNAPDASAAVARRTGGEPV